MSKLFDELEAKFKNIETGIENKKKFINDLCNDQEKLLNHRFNVKNSTSKYAKELNDQRERLLDQIKVSIRLEIDKMTEAKSLCLNKENVQSYSKVFKKSLKLKRSKFNSMEVCIRTLINNDYKFSRQFSADNLIKFKDILSVNNFLIRKTNAIGEVYDLDATLVEECESSMPNLELIRLLIDGGANINARHDWDTALLNASRRGHKEVVGLLLDQGAAINAKGGDGETALMEATRNDHLEVMKLLLDNGADLNNKDINEETPLILACERGNLEMVNLLLVKRAVENKYKDVVLALETASRHGKLEIVKQILDRGVDVRKNAYHGSALASALRNRHLEVVRVLLDHGAHDEYINESLIEASCKGFLEIVKLLIEKKADINAKDCHGDIALIQASSNDHFEVVKLLLNNGADANAQDKDGLTALLRFYFLAFYLNDPFFLFSLHFKSFLSRNKKPIIGKWCGYRCKQQRQSYYLRSIQRQFRNVKNIYK